MVSHRAREMASLTELAAENLMNQAQQISQHKAQSLYKAAEVQLRLRTIKIRSKDIST